MPICAHNQAAINTGVMSSRQGQTIRPFAAYHGDDPYLFVSYSHRDTALVFPELERLRELGFNVWYDEGISPGTQWSDELAHRIDGCQQFVFFVTPRSAASQHCSDEAFYALDKGIPIRAVHLEPTQLPPGLQLRMGSQQAILKYESTAERYQEKLRAALSSKLPSARRTSSAQPTRRFRFSGLLAGALLAIVAGTGAWYANRAPDPRDASATESSASRSAVPALAVKVAENAMAVLPFVLRSANASDAYISDGMADTLISKLQVLDQLSVLSTASTSPYAARDNPVAAVASELGVPWVVHGSVQIIGDNLRITTELLRADDGDQRWTQSYDGKISDLFSIQDSVVSDLVAALELSLEDQQRVAKGYQPDLAAYEQLILGRTAMDRGTSAGIERAVGHFRSAIELDPDYPDAYISLAEAYGLQDTHIWGSNDSYSGMPSARVRELQRPLIERALALDPEAGAAYAVLGTMNADQQQAQALLQRAIDLSPAYAPAYIAFANLHLLRSGNFQQALAMISKALELDPLSPTVRYIHAKAVWSTGDNEAALALMVDNVRHAPEYSPSYKLMARWQMQISEPAHALRWIREARRIDPSNPSLWGEFGGECGVLAELGLVEEARQCSSQFAQAHPESIAARRDALWLANDVGGLVDLYAQAIETDPGNLYRVNQLTYFLLLAGQHDRLEQIFATYFPRIHAGLEPANALTLWPTLTTAMALCDPAEPRPNCANLLEMAELGVEEQQLVYGGGFLIGNELAQLRMIQGRTDEALEALGQARSQTSFLWHADPVYFSPLATDPRFQAIQDQMATHIAAQQADYAADPHRPLF